MKYYNSELDQFLTPGDQRIRFGTLLSEKKLNSMNFFKVKDKADDYSKNALGGVGIDFRNLMHKGPLVRRGSEFIQTYELNEIGFDVLTRTLNYDRLETDIHPTIVRSPSGVNWKITISDAGVLSTEVVTSE